MTIHELNLHIWDYTEKMKANQDEELTLAYLGAYWQRVKRMPDLKELIRQPEQKKKQTDEEMFAEMLRIHAKMKGG